MKSSFWKVIFDFQLYNRVINSVTKGDIKYASVHFYNRKR